MPDMPWIGAVVYMVMYPLLTTGLSWFLFKLGYKSGIDGMQKVMATGKLDLLQVQWEFRISRSRCINSFIC